VATLPILEIGHPTLRVRAREVRDDELGTPELLRICDDLVETMRAANGAGLAAPQVDIPLRIFAVEIGENPRYPYKPRLGRRVLVNPVVTPVSEETYESYEGCLSIPGLRGLLPRFVEVEVAYRGPDGREHRERFGGLSAGTMQHELDHLDGILFPDRVEDTTTFCTWDTFRAYRQDAWLESIRPLLERFPGEPEAVALSASPAGIDKGKG
jgi:peptide deformylase